MLVFNCFISLYIRLILKTLEILKIHVLWFTGLGVLLSHFRPVLTLQWRRYSMSQCLHATQLLSSTLPGAQGWGPGAHPGQGRMPGPGDTCTCPVLIFGCGPILKSLLNPLQYCFCFPCFGHRHGGSYPPDQGLNPHPRLWKVVC